ncbi:MAG: SHOCT domain-containing protein [Acidimicrobiales bacterium]|jgi:uncharacterized membrane protein
MRLRLGLGYGFHHGPRVLAVLILLLVIAALVVGVVALVRMRRYPATHLQAGTWPPPDQRTDPALTELRVRYARGELSWEEYAQKAANLGFRVNPGPYFDPNQPPPAP